MQAVRSAAFLAHSKVEHALQEFGDGIMSAIDMFASIEDIEGKLGEKRLCLTLNGKVNHRSCLPHCDV